METATEKQGRGIEAKALLGQVKAGVASIYESGAWKEALAYNARFWSYSFGNQLLIAMQAPEAQRVAGFQTWKGLGRHVKKGEKGLAILRPMFGGARTNAATVTDTATGEEKAVKGQRLIGFSVAYVFDVAQTDGAPVKELVHRLKGAAPEGLRAGLEAFARAQGVHVKVDAAGTACGFIQKTSEGPSITLSPSLEPLHACKTLIHELGHFLCGHLEERRAEVARDARELEAESAAFIVGAALGVDFSEYSFGYLASWAQGMDPEARDKALTKAGEAAARAAKKILEGLGAGEALA